MLGCRNMLCPWASCAAFSSCDSLTGLTFGQLSQEPKVRIGANLVGVFGCVLRNHSMLNVFHEFDRSFCPRHPSLESFCRKLLLDCAPQLHVAREFRFL